MSDNISVWTNALVYVITIDSTNETKHGQHFITQLEIQFCYVKQYSGARILNNKTKKGTKAQLNSV